MAKPGQAVAARAKRGRREVLLAAPELWPLPSRGGGGWSEEEEGVKVKREPRSKGRMWGLPHRLSLSLSLALSLALSLSLARAICVPYAHTQRLPCIPSSTCLVFWECYWQPISRTPFPLPPSRPTPPPLPLRRPYALCQLLGDA